MKKINLKEYFYSKRLSPWRFAKENHISHGAMANWLSGKVIPSYNMACVLEKATNGEITVEDLRGNPNELI